MRLLRAIFLLATLVISCASARATEGKILKVLPHYLDLHGRHALSPSLYDRDAYQAFLRRNPQERSTLRFDIQWKSSKERATDLKLRLELRGSKSVAPLVLEQSVKRKGPFSQWSSLKLEEADYHKTGDLIAWKVSLWDGDRFLADQRSFLW